MKIKTRSSFYQPILMKLSFSGFPFALVGWLDRLSFVVMVLIF